MKQFFTDTDGQFHKGIYRGVLAAIAVLLLVIARFTLLVYIPVNTVGV